MWKIPSLFFLEKWLYNSGNFLQIFSEQEFFNKDQGIFKSEHVVCSQVQLWDVERAKRSRVMTGHSSRVSSLAWNQHILSSGSRDGSILHSDDRVADYMVGRSDAHTQVGFFYPWQRRTDYWGGGISMLIPPPPCTGAVKSVVSRWFLGPNGPWNRKNVCPPLV